MDSYRNQYDNFSVLEEYDDDYQLGGDNEPKSRYFEEYHGILPDDNSRNYYHSTQKIRNETINNIQTGGNNYYDEYITGLRQQISRNRKQNIHHDDEVEQYGGNRKQNVHYNDDKWLDDDQWFDEVEQYGGNRHHNDNQWFDDDDEHWLDDEVEVEQYDGNRKQNKYHNDDDYQFGGEKELGGVGSSVNHDSLDQYENEFHKIFNRARGYRQRVYDSYDKAQKGGAEAKKRNLNKTMALMIKVVDHINKEGKSGGLIRSKLMSVAKLIVDEAKKITNAPEKVNAQGKTVIEITPQVETESLRLAKNPEKYVNIVKARPPKPRKNSKNSKSVNSNTYSVNKSSKKSSNSRKQKGGYYEAIKNIPGQLY